MSGLSESERAGCKDILNLMTTSSILSLCDTITNKLIVVESFTEATDTILSFTKNAEEFLRRKKVHRDLIFKYLVKEGVAMSPNSEKHQLVKRTLELWSSGETDITKRLPQEPNESHQSTVTETSEDFNPQALGKQFCQWFFQLLNSQNPSLGQQPQDWGPQHFWPDVKLHLVSCAGSKQREKFLGSELVNLRLLALTKEERLVLSPNLEPNGLNVLASPHGLVLVAVAGTIHRDGVCLGIFEQIFGLISSPLENNRWKIKFVNLKIKGQDALEEKVVAAPSLSSNSAELQLLCS
ncbi:uncharacterized protein C3orf38 homolog [Takifugu flavidus]|uniref:NTF2 domain-containing protein n=1 Tax=Takifugu flavidus TaxID=433684 RepID=A0A5C6PP52_9TELE|nr:uncharacterized protein C3orf38 homolog [Takifugu flavidus]TWW80636.1 hypothetical protein D4764_01G0004510 [Takifugu flavidus]